MQNHEILFILKQILKDKCEVTTILDENSKIVDDLQLDSVYLLTMAVEIENHFKILLNEGDDLPQTVGELRDLIAKRLDENSN